MNKRYQIFVSSTYADLKEERSKVIQTIMALDCIPSGMELFPAIDEEQFEFIKNIIDDCDYYALIIGGRYGSLTKEGISYTEKEYDYAIQSGIKVMAFLHAKPDDIPVAKSDIDPLIREKLHTFREKVAEGRLVDFWSKAEELPGILALSLTKTIKLYPAVGWVRASESTNEEILTEINELRKENLKLSGKLTQLAKESMPLLDNLASLDDTIEIHGDKWNINQKRRIVWDLNVSWSRIFQLLSPFLLDISNDDTVKYKLGDLLYSEKIGEPSSSNINDQDFQTIKIQFTALNLIKVNYTKTTKGGMALFWYLTEKGKQLMMELRTIKAKK